MNEGAFDAVGISLGDRSIRWDAEQDALAKAVLELASFAEKDQQRMRRAAAFAKPLPPRQPAAALTEVAPPLSEELIALKDKGEDLQQLGQLGRQDRASLKARLKELGFKSMRMRVKMEEELIQLPPPRKK